MQAVHTQLPGGVGVTRGRSFRFRPIVGELELTLSESRLSSQSLPAKVTQALVVALEQVGGQVATPESIDSLCVQDRQFLMRQLAIHMGTDRLWLSAPCIQCGESFDVSVQQSELPVIEAPDGFPETEVNTSVGRCRFRLATGADQRHIAHLTDEQLAQRHLLHRCVQQVNDRPCPDALPFTATDIAAIDEALDSIAPGVVVEIQTVCPHCGAENQVGIDPYVSLQRREDDIFHEIHQLAWYYHWREADILALPRTRRKLYLRLIDQSRGFSQ